MPSLIKCNQNTDKSSKIGTFLFRVQQQKNKEPLTVFYAAELFTFTHHPGLEIKKVLDRNL